MLLIFNIKSIKFNIQDKYHVGTKIVSIMYRAPTYTYICINVTQSHQMLQIQKCFRSVGNNESTTWKPKWTHKLCVNIILVTSKIWPKTFQAPYKGILEHERCGFTERLKHNLIWANNVHGNHITKKKKHSCGLYRS